MKRLATLSLLACSLGPAWAIAGSSVEAPPRGSDSDRPSKNGRLATDVGGAKVVVTYGRPAVKGRKVWDELVPAGKVWRAGANEATVFLFEKDVMVEGKKLAAGAYAFFAIPGKDAQADWILIFNREAKQWGAYKYDEKQDALRVTVKPRASTATEELTYEKDGSSVVLKWEKVAVPVHISAAG